MLRHRAHLLRAVTMVADAIAMASAFVTAYYLAGPLMTRWFDARVVLPLSRYFWVLSVEIPIGWVLFAYFGGYDFARFERWTANAGRLAIPLLLHGALLASIVFFTKEELFARRVIAVIAALNVVAVPLGRGAVMWLAARTGEREGRLRRVLVVGGGEGAKRFLRWAEDAGWGLRVLGVLAGDPADIGVPVLGKPSDIGRVLDNEVVDDVILAEPARDLGEVQELIARSEEVGCIVHIQSDFFQAALSRPHVESFGGMSFLTFSATPYAPALLAFKRTIDIVGSLVFLVAMALPMACIYVAIRRTSKGPAIFAQERCGLNGRRFTMYKFRSMVERAEQMREELDALNESDGPVFKIADDPRLTAVGRRLRRYSLDELPQLWNVLRGDMSLVGPRPPLPAEVARYERWQRRRLSMRPGMTGLWQIRGRHRVGFRDWMRYDLEYIDTWSLWLDLKILLKTAPVVLGGQGV